MKIKIIKPLVNEERDAKRGIFFFDSKGNQYRLFENKCGEIIIQTIDGSLILRPVMSNEINIQTEQ